LFSSHWPLYIVATCWKLAYFIGACLEHSWRVVGTLHKGHLGHGDDGSCLKAGITAITITVETQRWCIINEMIKYSHIMLQFDPR
jgi:hypothetical protein